MTDGNGRVLRRLEALSILVKEGLEEPVWASYHVAGIVDQYCLDRFFRRRRSGECQLVVSLVEVVARACRVSEEEAHSVLEAAPTLGSESRAEGPGGVIAATNDASAELQRLVYSLTILRRPEQVVEVGVGRGATTRAILSALAENRAGHLYSIELPALRSGYGEEVGVLVSPELRQRWTLVLGPSKRMLRRLPPFTTPIDLFVHDGPHSYYLQRSEYRCALEQLKDDGLLVTDDVANDSFLEVSEAHSMRQYLVEQPKEYRIGVACHA